MTDNPNASPAPSVAGALPPDVLRIARATRDAFGPGVKLLFAADVDRTWGNAKWDDEAAEIERDRARDVARDLGSL